MKLFSFLCFCWIGFNSVYATNLNNRIQYEIGQIMRQLDIVGLSVVVVNKGDIIYNANFGVKNPLSSKRDTLCSTDVFRIASISKTFVATAIMQLIESNRLNLDDDINKYLKFSVIHPDYEHVPITVRMLLTHRSSLNDSQGYYWFDQINPSKNKNYKLCYNNYAPGADYQYCNYNYNLLGAVIEGVTGERFDDYIEKNIIQPLGLSGSYNVNRLNVNNLVPLFRYDSISGEIYEVKDVYKPYAWHLNIENYRKGIYTPLLAPTSGMKVTSLDLAVFMMMHMNNGIYKGRRIISAESESLMREGYIQKANYAFSFRKYSGLIPGHILYGQTGGAYGLFAAMIFEPQNNFGFVVIANGGKSHYIDGYGDLHKSVIRCMYNALIK